jgi:hypothetical protein
MNQAIERFCTECIELAGDDNDGLRAAIDAVSNEAISNPNARAFLAAVEWICTQPRTPAEN